jgi:hypothetical protein
MPFDAIYERCLPLDAWMPSKNVPMLMGVEWPSEGHHSMALSVGRPSFGFSPDWANDTTTAAEYEFNSKMLLPDGRYKSKRRRLAG